MLVSDLIEIPHEKLADWIALIGSCIAYLIFAFAIFFGLRVFIAKTRMKFVGNLLAALVLVAGLLGYFAVFVALDTATFSRAVLDAFRHTPASHNDALLTRLSNERARSIIEPYGPIELRRIGFYVLPVVAAALAAITAPRARRV